MAQDPDEIRILLTTDNHVGYNETDPIRGDDSAITFEEVMRIAKDREVDMVLQGGDLFHINKPSKKALYQVIRTLRQNCLGDKPCPIEVLNHGTLSLDEDFNYPNFEDANLNVAIPVFAISGNHDDSGGSAMLSPMDVLSMTGLVNYYGRVPENDNIAVEPLLLRKGTTKVALYGLSNVRDERLFRTFRERNAKFLLPSTGSDEWFNLLSVHQNHISHTDTNYLPEEFIPSFFDMVVWGHEHKCLIDPVQNDRLGFTVIQPGSSVATSLCDAEAEPKYVGILSIKGKEYALEKIRLRTVRPFKMETVCLSTDSSLSPGPENKVPVTRWLIARIERLVDAAIQEWTNLQYEDAAGSGASSHTAEAVPLPLIRLRVDYSGGYEVENPTRFSNRFVGKVANVNDVIQYFKRKGGSTGRKRKTQHDDNEAEIVSALQDVQLDNMQVQTLVEEFLRNEQLKVLAESGLGEAIKEFVEKDDKTALKLFVDKSLKEQLKELMTSNTHDAKEVLSTLKQRLSDKDNLTAATPEPAVRKPRGGKKQAMEPVKRSARSKTSKSSEIVYDSDEDPEDDEPEVIISSDDDDPDVVMEESDEEVASPPAPSPSPTPQRGRGKAAKPKEPAQKSRATRTTKAAKAKATKEPAQRPTRANSKKQPEPPKPIWKPPKFVDNSEVDDDDGFG